MVRMRKAVDIRHVSKEIDGIKVLDKVSLKVERDERVVICGPSGSGKTTLIRCLNGLSTFSAGSVTVLGVQLNGDPQSIRHVREKTGMCFQNFNLFPHLTILENCTLALRHVRKMSEMKSIEMAQHYLERVKIIDQADKYPVTLSGGQQQRAAIARALCMEPELMLFDEPTSALDPEMVSEVLAVLSDIAKSGMTMICVTHEMRFARKFADKIVMLDEGKVVINTDTQDFFKTTDNPRVKSFLRLLDRR